MEAFKQIFDVKVFGAMAVTKAFAPQLLKAEGTIVNIGSIATYFLAPIFGGYSGANSALEYLSHQMRMELSPFGVGVVHVSPHEPYFEILKPVPIRNSIVRLWILWIFCLERGPCAHETRSTQEAS